MNRNEDEIEVTAVGDPCRKYINLKTWKIRDGESLFKNFEPTTGEKKCQD